MDPTVALGLAGVLGSIVTVAITKVFDYLATRGDLAKKARADAIQDKSLEDQITERVLARARAELDSMQAQIDILQNRLTQYEEWASALCNQVIGLGQVPCKMPDRKGKM